MLLFVINTKLPDIISIQTYLDVILSGQCNEWKNRHNIIIIIILWLDKMLIKGTVSQYEGHMFNLLLIFTSILQKVMNVDVMYISCNH